MSDLIRYAVVENGVVINVIEYAPTAKIGDGLEVGHTVIASSDVQIGWAYDDIKFIDTSPPVPLIDRQTAAWNDIKAHRDHLTETGGYKVGTKWYHSDQKSRSQQLGLVLLGANIPANTQWKTLDGSFILMTQTLAGQILVAAAVSDMTIFAAAETHKTAMEASADPSAYDFSTGWPAVYTG